QREAARAGGQRDFGAERAVARGRGEVQVDLFASRARDVGGGRPARAVVARRREPEAVFAAAERGQRQIRGRVGRRPVVVVVAAVLLVVAEARPLRLAGGSFGLPLEQIALA